jgi:hypothetical protein
MDRNLVDTGKLQDEENNPQDRPIAAESGAGDALFTNPYRLGVEQGSGRTPQRLHAHM